MQARALSLQARQLLAATLGLLAFLGLTGYALDRAFIDTARSNQEARLGSYARAYLAGLDFTRSGALWPPEAPPDPRFGTPGSGLYAAIVGDGVDWHSASTLSQVLPDDIELPLGEVRFEGPLSIRGPNGEKGEVYRYAIGTAWEEPEVEFTVAVSEDAATITRQIAVFRRALWGYLGGAGLLLLGVQTLILRWSLQPLRRVTRAMDSVQRGRDKQLEGQFPHELSPLTDSINAFIDSEREHLERYRHTLADLAHSLKTPLAVLRTRLEDGASEAELREEVQAQVQRMTDIVGYQLSRAATSGHQLFAAPIEIEGYAEEVVRGLEKVYASKGALCEFEIDPAARFFGEPGDLQELLGNLLENAFKWTRRRVVLVVRTLPPPAGRRPGVEIVVEDDGPGIPPERVASLLQRGVRGDERVQGHGIGLAIVQDIVRSYRGELRVDASPELGGARFGVHIPPGL